MTMMIMVLMTHCLRPPLFISMTLMMMAPLTRRLRPAQLIRLLMMVLLTRRPRLPLFSR